MTNDQKPVFIELVHTAIRIFFKVVILFLLLVIDLGNSIV